MMSKQIAVQRIDKIFGIERETQTSVHFPHLGQQERGQA